MKKNRFREAFVENANLFGLAAAATVAMATVSFVPLLAGIVLEAAYLLFVPDSKWYEKRLATKYDAEVEARRQEIKNKILPTLRPDIQARFQKMENMRKQIETHAEPNKAWFREVIRKLDYLLEKYLQIASKEGQFRQYLQSLHSELKGSGNETWSAGKFDLDNRRDRRAGSKAGMNQPSAFIGGSDEWVQQKVTDIRKLYDRAQDEIAALLDRDPDHDTKAILEKRQEVLARRQESVGKIEQILLNTSHQLQLLEDTFGLINDEIRARSPEQLLSDIEEVVITTDTMASTLEELAPYEQLTGHTA
jgi:hypothetical protein